jgi:hypothetical protein
LPFYNALGGPKGKGHVTFNRARSQYLDAGPRTLNIATNGGLTIVAVVRFTGTPGYFERIIDLGSGTAVDSLVVARLETSTNLFFQFRNGGYIIGGYDDINSTKSSTGVIVQNSWLTVVVQYHASSSVYWLTVKNMNTGSDPLDWFDGNTDGNSKVIVSFTDPPTARYVRILPRTWSGIVGGKICLRVGLLIGQNIQVVDYSGLAYSSTHDNATKGTGLGQGMLDSPAAWCAASNDLNQWIRMDTGQVKVINGVVTQGHQGWDQWVTSYFIQASSDGNTWFSVYNAGSTGAGIASAAVTDRAVSATYMGRSAWSHEAYFNGDMAGVFVVDEYLSTDATSAIAESMARGEDLTTQGPCAPQVISPLLPVVLPM